METREAMNHISKKIPISSDSYSKLRFNEYKLGTNYELFENVYILNKCSHVSNGKYTFHYKHDHYVPKESTDVLSIRNTMIVFTFCYK